jgi:hypothetical protein
VLASERWWLTGTARESTSGGAKIILLTVEGLGPTRSTRGSGRAKSAVWRWPERIMREGNRRAVARQDPPASRKPFDPAIIEQVLAGTAEDPPGETTRPTAKDLPQPIQRMITHPNRRRQPREF